jgi:hypothetical protein
VTTQDEREALAAEFDHHVSEEERILGEYHRLADKLPDGPLSVVVNHIATDEEMHHFLLQTLADWLRDPDDEVSTEGLDHGELLARTRDLKRHEQETIDACHALKERMSGRDAEVLGGILEAISLDSQKHRRLLAVVETLAGESGS